MGLDSAGGFRDGWGAVSVDVEGVVMSLLITPTPSHPLNEPTTAVILKPSQLTFSSSPRCSLRTCYNSTLCSLSSHIVMINPAHTLTFRFGSAFVYVLPSTSMMKDCHVFIIKQNQVLVKCSFVILSYAKQ